MNEDEYLKDRLDDQIAWYDKKSGENKRIYFRLRTVQIIAGALIPFLSGLIIAFKGYEPYGTALVGVLGVIVTISTGKLSLGRHHENWIEYRKMSESLRHEKFLFKTGAAPYNSKKRFDFFVQTVESLLANENTNWSQYMRQRDKSENEKQKDE